MTSHSSAGVPERLSVKIPMVDPDSFDRQGLIPVFHRWIKEDTLDGLMIDVHDYTHVPNGPGVILVGHASHVRADETRGEIGLEYERKRDAQGDLRERVRDTWARALHAARALEGDNSVAPPIRFRTNEIVVRVPDRLAIPATDEGLALLSPVLTELAEKVYPGQEVTVERVGMSNGPLSVRVRVAYSGVIEEVADRVGPPASVEA